MGGVSRRGAQRHTYWLAIRNGIARVQDDRFVAHQPRCHFDLRTEVAPQLNSLQRDLVLRINGRHLHALRAIQQRIHWQRIARLRAWQRQKAIPYVRVTVNKRQVAARMIAGEPEGGLIKQSLVVLATLPVNLRSGNFVSVI